MYSEKNGDEVNRHSSVLADISAKMCLIHQILSIIPISEIRWVPLALSIEKQKKRNRKNAPRLLPPYLQEKKHRLAYQLDEKKRKKVIEHSIRTYRTSLEGKVCAERLKMNSTPESEPAVVRFGITADCHLMGGNSPAVHVDVTKNFIEEMRKWSPDFVIDVGDFACQAGGGPTTSELHDAQLEGLEYAWSLYKKAPCPAYIAVGNHDVGWIKGGDEVIKPEQLYTGAHGGEDITKAEFLAITNMPHRYYSFDIKAYHFIVLDGNNPRGNTAVAPGRDGVVGAYWIDDMQKEWLAADLAANREKIKVVFCHEELHHTPVEGSGEGGDVPFPPVGKEHSYVDNGWELREMFAADGEVLVCFFAHKHRNRWTVYGGVNYITLAATHWEGSYAKVTISDKLYVEGAGNQRGYAVLFSEDK